MPSYYKNEHTVGGNIGSDIDLNEVNGDQVANFRLAMTPRIPPQNDGDDWDEGETVWWNVEVWGAKAEAVKNNFSSGDPVEVQGRVKENTWKDDQGEDQTTMTIRAKSVSEPVLPEFDDSEEAGEGTIVPEEDELDEEIGEDIEEEVAI